MVIPPIGRRLRRRSSVFVGALAASAFAFATWSSSETTLDEQYAKVEHLLPRTSFENASPLHRQMLVDAVESGASSPVACCFAPGTTLDQAYIDAFNHAIQGTSPLTFQLTGRWGSTANTPGPLNQGDPTTITYSFVPDGVTIPSEGIGPTAPNNLNSTFNGLFGSAATWQQFWHDSFAAWGELIGVEYVFEPNDDGAPMFTSPGVSGVRGDVRIAGRLIDGGSGVLAFNFFPNGGDMIMDTGDTGLWSNSANNFRILRNTIMHEHGHGLGILHVCPISNSKLMEPFLSSAFDGPQIDDINAGQRWYGDRLEPNDDSTQAEDLGVLPTTNLAISDVSIDGLTDEDWYEFFLGQRRDITISVNPTGASYQQGPQTQQCNTGTSYDSRTQRDLAFELFDPSGTSLFVVNGTAAGQLESISDFPLSATGTYFLRVFGTGADSVQLYDLDISNSPFTVPPFTISLPDGAPERLSPDSITIVDIDTINGLSSPNRAAAELRISVNGGPFTSSPLFDLGGVNGFQGTLPALSSLSEIDWYVSIPATSGGSPQTLPQGAPATGTFHSTYDGNVLMSVFADDFQTDQGWTVTNDPSLTGGAWQRGVPAGGGGRSDPAFDADGSGACYLTENAAGNTDVDGGQTILTSPAIDLTGFDQAVVRYQFWYRNDFGASPNQDEFVVEADLGTGFIPIDIYNANANAWLERSITLPIAPATTAFRIRFIAQDVDPGSVVEAGVDAVEVFGFTPLPVLGATCSVGNAGLGGEPVFLVNGTTGGPQNRVELLAGQPIRLAMDSPSTVGPAGAPFVVLAALGVPDPSVAVPVPGIGELCIPIPAIAIGPLFSGPTPTPWADVFLSGLGTPDVLTMQGVLFEDTTTPIVRISNAVSISVR